MSSVFSRPQAPTIMQSAAPGAEVTTPSALPDKNSFELRKQAATKMAMLGEEGTTAADTQLTASKLGDVTKAYRRFGSAGSGSSPTIVG